MADRPKVLVFGAYGLIGSAICRAFIDSNFDVIGVGRSRLAATQSSLNISWAFHDLATIKQETLRDLVCDVDVIVNAAGALQTSLKDNTEAIHTGFVKRLAESVSGQRVVQISAAGAELDAETLFLASKASADRYLLAVHPNAAVLRPSLVLGQEAYGGSALLRALAAMPVVGPKVFADVKIHVIALDELAQAVVHAAQDRELSGAFDLTAQDPIRFDDLVLAYRKWMGLTPWRLRLKVPKILLNLTMKLSDMLGWLGWRPPLRTTAVKVLARGICANNLRWTRATGQNFSTLSQMLARTPATSQDVLAARVYLLVPLAIATLSLFWCVSGLIGFLKFDTAAEVLISRGMSDTVAKLSVLGGSVMDVVLGMCVVLRKYIRLACLGMIALTLSYLFGATIWATDLWADPLGPLVKTVPAMVLACIPLALLRAR